MTNRSLGIALLVGALTVMTGLAGGALVWWWTTPRVAPPTPSPAPATPVPAAVTPSPVPTPEVAQTSPPTADASPELTPAAAEQKPIATPTPLPPSPRPSAAPSGPSLSALLLEAEGAAAAGEYDKAAALYGRAADLDPRSAAAREGRARVASIVASLARSFAVGQTTAHSSSGRASGLELFEPDGVDVKTTGRIPGTLGLGISPAHVKPGDSYVVRGQLQNDGKRPIEIAQLTLVETAGAERIETSVAPRTRKIRSGGRELVFEHRGVWRDGVERWSLDVTVRSKAGDTYASQVVWR
jgi:hypothetical protein